MCEMLQLFVNTLTGGDKYSLLNRDNLMQPTEMKLSKKEKAYSQLFFVCLKFRPNFEHFEKKDDRHSLCISEITECKRSG